MSSMSEVWFTGRRKGPQRRKGFPGVPLRHCVNQSILFLLLCSCHKSPKTISFYYWRTQYQLDSSERETLNTNHVTKLYIRYFDIDYKQNDSVPAPVTPIRFLQAAATDTVVPVVYIKNRVFVKIDSAGVVLLARKTDTLIAAINGAAKIRVSEVQFDCDWTESTRDRYFQFLNAFRKLHGTRISSTIRLHQVKYADRMGVPPVDRAVLMFYNIGNIDAGNNNSIYEKSMAEKYSPSIRLYPMPLDVALPIFSWALLIRDGTVVTLLNKMNFGHFENDSNFIREKGKRFSVRHAGFHGGYYFQTGDEVKIEYVSKADLMGLIGQVNAYATHPVRQLIFYDLDKTNLGLYEKDLFREILDHSH